MAKVLVIEDTPPVRMAIVDVLAEQGHEVVEAANGREGLELIESAGADQFALIITDVLMPELDGVEVIKSIRLRYPSLKVLAISGGAPNLPAGYCLKMTEMFQADGVLYKPFLNHELAGVVERLLGSQPVS